MRTTRAVKRRDEGRQVARGLDRVDALDWGRLALHPLGELVGKQPTHESLIDLELVDVHPSHQP